MTAAAWTLLVLCAQDAPPDDDPFDQVMNVLYNAFLLPAEELLPDPFGGPVRAPQAPGLPPGWLTEGRARFELDAATALVPPASLAIADPQPRAAAVSLPIPVKEASHVIARAAIHVQGNPQGARLALRWYMPDGTTTATVADPPDRGGTFVDVRMAARVPEGAGAVALVLEATGAAPRVHFDALFLGFAGMDMRVFAFPAGYHPYGLKEALIRTRLPLVTPLARVAWTDRTTQAQVHPLRPHVSGFYYYVVDLTRLDTPGSYTLEIIDAAVPDRKGAASFTLTRTPYAALAAEACAFVRKAYAAPEHRRRPTRVLAEDLLIMARVSALGDLVPAAAAALAARAASLDAAGGAEDAAFAAWALAQANAAGAGTDLTARAMSLLRAAWEQESAPRRVRHAAALLGAASLLVRTNDERCRDIADDMLGAIVDAQQLDGRFPGPEHIGAVAWIALACAEYARCIPDTRPASQGLAVIERIQALGERLISETPFGHPRVIENDIELEFTRGRDGVIPSMLAMDVVFLALERPESVDPFISHIERHLQFLLGYNPLGLRLDLAAGASLRAGAGERFRPGEEEPTSGADGLSAYLRAAWAAQVLDDRLKAAEERWQDMLRRMQDVRDARPR